MEQRIIAKILSLAEEFTLNRIKKYCETDMSWESWHGYEVKGQYKKIHKA